MGQGLGGGGVKGRVEGGWSESRDSVKRGVRFCLDWSLSGHPVDHPVAGNESSSSHVSGCHIGREKNGKKKKKKRLVMAEMVSGGFRGVFFFSSSPLSVKV